MLERLKKLDEVLAGVYGNVYDAVTDVVGELLKLLANVPVPAAGTARLNPFQFRFTLMVGVLVVYAYTKGYTLTFGNTRVDRGCTVCGGGKRRITSLHYDALAVDLNLFRNGTYLTRTEDHFRLGAFWESMGDSWGGRFGDGNHYSLEFDGRK